MGAGGDLDVEALLQRLQPAQRHAEPGIALAGRDRLEQLVGRAGVIDQFDVEIVLLEEAVLDGDRHRREADRAGVPGQLQLARRAGERGHPTRSGTAETREIDAGVAARNGNACAPITPSGAASRRGRAGAQQGAPIQQRPAAAARSSDIVLLLLRTARDHARRNARTRAAAWHRELFDVVQSRRDSGSRSAEVDAAMMRGNNGIVNKMEF